MIDILAGTWKSQGNGMIFLKLLKSLYDNERCSQGNRLHLLGLTRKRQLLENYEKILPQIVPALNFAVPEGKIQDPNSSFTRKEVDTSLYPALIISAQNTFQLDEIVAVDHTGNLLGGRRKIFYGIVREIIQRDNEALYKVSTHCAKGVWSDHLIVSAIMLGKIPKSQLDT